MAKDKIDRELKTTIIQNELREMRDEQLHSRKKSRGSRSGDSNYERESLRVGEYYHHPSFSRRPRKYYHIPPPPREVKVDLLHFHGKDNVEAYLDLEIKVEQIFACH
ncbi:hypothetical protein V8G54_018235 [Vigna mungo]|uniref:Uncharacterized protein n=1 Tax=Vigna mungo TaxID=3915 RepID=A0AAQ3N835_VIGMU